MSADHSATTTMSEIDALLQEHRKFPPPDEFRKGAHVSDQSLYKSADKAPEAFWEAQARIAWLKNSPLFTP